MDKKLELHIENARAMARSALGTLQALDDELKAAIKLSSRPMAQVETAKQARRKAREKSNGRHEQVRKFELRQS